MKIVAFYEAIGALSSCYVFILLFRFWKKKFIRGIRAPLIIFACINLINNSTCFLERSGLVNGDLNLLYEIFHDNLQEILIIGWFFFLYSCLQMMAKKELMASKREVEKANRSLQNHFAFLSHEIRTPLTALVGFSDLLQHGSTSKEEQETYIGIIHSNGKRLLSLLNDLLDISKVEAGGPSARCIDVEITKEIDDVLSLFQMEVREKGIDLKFKNFCDSSVVIKTDPNRFKQILSNLVSNAIKFTDKGGILIVLEEVECTPYKKSLNILVKDTGFGINQDQLKRLFQPFSQADVSVSNQFGGTGLGLYLSKNLAKAINSDITVIQSKPGVGTTFCLSLNSCNECRIPVVEVS